MTFEVRQGDCVELMAAMPAGSVDAVVCDPPYGLEFMGKDWDRFAPQKTTARVQRTGGSSFATFEDKNMTLRTGTSPKRTTYKCRTCDGWSGTFSEARRARQKPCECEQPDLDYAGAPPALTAFQGWCLEWATEALRVLKPGGHLLAFGGTRTYHRLVCAVEDAGFEIRDTISWLYGSGFPKSLDVGKAIDKRRDDDLAPVRHFLHVARADRPIAEIAAHFGVDTRMVHKWMGERDDPQAHCPTWEQWVALKGLLGFDGDLDDEVWRLNGRKGKPGHEREVVGTIRKNQPGGTSAFAEGGVGAYTGDDSERPVVGGAVTPEAERWEGWGTALKPAHEPVVVARKPLSGTVAGNVLEHGTGALNVDGCRIDGEPLRSPLKADGTRSRQQHEGWTWVPDNTRHGPEEPCELHGVVRCTICLPNTGRWPANVVLSHTEDCKEQPSDRWNDERLVDWTWSCTPGCPVRLLDEQTGELHGAGFAQPPQEKWAKPEGYEGWGNLMKNARGARFGDFGGASRFFYVAKASRGERNAGLEGFEEAKPHDNAGHVHADERAWDIPGSHSTARANHHPTVKPISLMRWLVRLVTPAGGTVLDPFAGSGTTGCAAVLEGFAFVGLEREAEYVAIAEARIAWWHKHRGDGEAAEILAAGELRDSVEATGQLGMFDQPEEET